MKKKRIIPVLILREGWLVQSYRFNEYRKLGNPKHSVQRFSQWDADELIYLDITPKSSHVKARQDLNGETYSTFFDLISDISKVSRMPISFGGGIETLKDIEERLRAGADKVCINSAAIENPEFIGHAVKEFGAQCIVVSIDYWSDRRGNFVYSHSKKKILDLDLFTWAKEMEYRGAGEILINDVVRDGQQSGYNLQASAQVSDLLKCPVISCGGAGNWMHMNELLENTNVDAVAAGNIFHFQDQSVYLARKTLFEAGRQVRPPSLHLQ